ncbi:Magnesium and cobalt efflux protein CorC [compost metagenome]
MLRLSPERTLSVLQIGITLVGAISAAVGGAGAEESLSPFFESQFGLTENIAEALSIGVVVLPLTVASVVIGELVPKSLALKNSRKIALISAYALNFFDTILSPIVNLLEGMTHFLVRLFQRKNKQGRVEVTTEETSISIDALSSAHKQFVLNLVNIESKRAIDMVVPWEKVTKVDVNLSSSEVLKVAVSSGHTRLPVISENKVLGLLHAKEFITLVGAGDSNWQSIIRPILQVQESDDALKALKLMQEKRSHMALVCDKENVDGIITLEDVIEEIIGEIADEDDDGLMKKLLISKSRRPLRKR